MTPHCFAHIEWVVRDLARAQRFYSEMFHWEFQPGPENYLIIKTPEGPGGGLSAGDPQPGQSPLVYIEVREIDPYLERAAKLGGRVIVPRTSIGRWGWYAIVADPDGNFIGLWEAPKEGGTEG